MGFCVYTVGDGTGGSEEMIGETPTREECVNLVLSRSPTANGATYSTDPNNLNCYAEFGMTGPNDSASWQTCQFPANVGVCEFSMGDGIGGTEERVGDAANTMDCVAMVIALRPDANGATYSNAGGQGCYAEFGMTGSNGSESWQTCAFVGGSAVPVNGCVFGMGDGTGGTETQVGNAANEAACVTMVQNSLQAAGANGATFNGD